MPFGVGRKWHEWAEQNWPSSKRIIDRRQLAPSVQTTSTMPSRGESPVDEEQPMEDVEDTEKEAETEASGKPTMEERQKKMAELRKKLVRGPIYPPRTFD